MTLSPHTISPRTRVTKGKRRVGRGNSTQKGTTAGKGTKGQKARSGGRSGLARKALKKSLLKVPKSRGFKSFHPKMATVTLDMLERVVAAGTVVTPVWLVAHRLIRTMDNGVKVLATGKITKAITVEGCNASKGAVAAIEKAGGKLVF